MIRRVRGGIRIEIDKRDIYIDGSEIEIRLKSMELITNLLYALTLGCDHSEYERYTADGRFVDVCSCGHVVKRGLL